jgi:hypothetical protein
MAPISKVKNASLEVQPMPNLPVACSLPNGVLQARAKELLPGLARRAMSVDNVEGGVQLRFEASTEMLQAIVQVIDTERQCCRFLRFDLSVEAGGAPMSLTVTGPPGTRDFLADLLSSDH